MKTVACNPVSLPQVHHVLLVVKQLKSSLKKERWTTVAVIPSSQLSSRER